MSFWVIPFTTGAWLLRIGLAPPCPGTVRRLCRLRLHVQAEVVVNWLDPAGVGQTGFEFKDVPDIGVLGERKGQVGITIVEARALEVVGHLPIQANPDEQVKAPRLILTLKVVVLSVGLECNSAVRFEVGIAHKFLTGLTPSKSEECRKSLALIACFATAGRNWPMRILDPGTHAQQLREIGILCQ